MSPHLFYTVKTTRHHEGQVALGATQGPNESAMDHMCVSTSMHTCCTVVLRGESMCSKRTGNFLRSK